MRAVADVPDRLLIRGHAQVAYGLPPLRAGQRYVTALPGHAPDGTPWVWEVVRVVPDTGRASARIDAIGQHRVLTIDRTPTTSAVAVEIIGRAIGSDRWHGLIRSTLQVASGLPGAWLVPDALAPVGGEMCLDPYVLTVRPGAATPAWVQSLSALSGQVYLSCDLHAHVPVSAGSPWAAIGVMDASELAARTLPGDGSSVAVRRTGSFIQIVGAGVDIDGYVSFGIHRRVDLRVDVPSRSVWARTTTPYTWSGPWTVPGSGALYVVGYMDHGVAGHLRLITSADDLTRHDAYPTGYSPGWTDP